VGDNARSRPGESTFWNTVWRWRRFILINLVVVTLIVSIVGLLLPSWYEAESTILPEVSEGGEIGFRLRELGLGSLIPSGSGESSAVLVAILRSRAVAEAVVGKLSLVDEYRLSSPEEAIEKLMELSDFNVNLDGTVSVRVMARRPELAAALANAFVEELDAFRKRNTMTKGRMARVFLEERLRESRKELKEAEDSLEAYQEKTSTPVLSKEMEGAARAAADLAAEYNVLEIELGIARRLWSEDSDRIRRIKLKLNEIKKRLDAVPEIGMGLGRLLREVRVQEELYSYLQARYEEAKIQEVKDTPTIQVLDKAYPPRHRAKPRRKLLVGTAGLLSLLAGIVAAVVLERHPGLRPYGYRR